MANDGTADAPAATHPSSAHISHEYFDMGQFDEPDARRHSVVYSP